MANINYIPYAQQIANIERQRKYAQLLQEQGAAPLESQQVSGIVVPTSPWLGLTKMLQAGLGGYLEGKAAKREGELDTQQREEAKKSIQDFMAASGPQKTVTQTPVIKQDFGQAATPEDYQNMMNDPQMGLAPKRRDVSQAATPEDVQDIVNQPYVTQDVTSYTPGLSRNEQIAKLLEMQAGGNKYVSAAVPTLTELMPKQTSLEMGAIDPSKFTPASIKAAMTANDPSLLQPVTSEKTAALPSAVQEYEYAVRQGFKGTLANYERQKAINVNVPAAETYGGLTPVIDPATGKTVYVRPGSKGSLQQVSGYKPVPTAPTESQTVSGTYASKVQDAEDVLGKFAAGSPYKPPSTKEQFKADIPFVGNQLVDQDTQAYKTAERSFIEAWLRKTSGAAISASEYDQARKQYIPQPGDTDAVLEQKRKSRQRVLQGMVRGAGASYQSDASSIPDGFIEVSP